MNKDDKDYFEKLNRRVAIGVVVFFTLAFAFLLFYACSLRTGDTMRGKTDTIHCNGGDSIIKHVIFRK